ncbi:sorting nexin-2 [Lepeophtheirus salmonis]|uniref:Sorting nexinlike [Tribolium castaneum] n=1 Tax=Lepeophtheirus salmonis TaxID=72036 RepID=A0A0K2V254_LEPSM|nr:sorting nexin-2-like [Lepeophtheirus salmonis]
MSKSKPIKQESEESNGSDIDIFQSVFVSKNTSGMVKIGSENDNRLFCGKKETTYPKVEGDEKMDPMKEDLNPDPIISVNLPIKKEDIKQQTKFKPEPVQRPRRNEDIFIEVIVEEPKKIGDGISSFMAYGIRTKTNSGLFTKSDSSVSRRFSDFLGLHEKLKEKYTPLGRIVPPAPDKNIVSTTKAKIIGNGMTGDGSATAVGTTTTAPVQNTNMNGGHSYNSNTHVSNNLTSSNFIQRRRLALERFVNRIAMHPVLNRDPDFIDFLENPRDLPRATSTSAISSASVFRLLGRVGDTMNKMTYKIIEETDPWFLENIQHVDNLETQLKKLFMSVESLVTSRQELANATSQFAIAMTLLAQAEEAHSLSRALSHLAKVEEKVESVQHEQSDADLFYLFELLKDYVGLVGAIKEAFHERDKAFQGWQHAQSMVIKKKEQKARAEMSGRFDKIPSASEEVSEWESRCEEARSHFDNVSSVIKIEIEFFDQYRVKDFKVSIMRYVEALHSAQVDLVKHWEEFLPEVKSILF